MAKEIFEPGEALMVHEFNVWSDHCLISLSLHCNTVIENCIDDSESFVIHKWSAELKNNFRSGLITKLPALNNVISNVDLNNRSAIDNMLTEFTSIIHNFTDPLFRKDVTINKNVSFNLTKNVKDKPWFDLDCERSRQLYVDALCNFNRYKSSAHREQLCIFKNRYKLLVKKKRNCYKLQQIKEIEKLRLSKPKEFWKYFKSKNVVNHKLSLDSFFKHFSELGNDIFQNVNTESENFASTNDFDCCYDSLDQPISVNEILEAVKSLKRGKAYGNDFLLNEYFIESMDISSSHLCDIFNKILDSGFFPSNWGEGVIIPLHK